MVPVFPGALTRSTEGLRSEIRYLSISLAVARRPYPRSRPQWPTCGVRRSPRSPCGCPNLPLKGHVYTVRGFVVPYAGYSGTPGILLEEISNPPCPYFEGTFEPSFFPSHFRPFTDRKTDISVFKEMLNDIPEKV
jgi:hypothetical protein